jgi:general secretion pathway protein G
MLNCISYAHPRHEGLDRAQVAADMHALGTAIDLFTLNTGDAPNQLADLNHEPAGCTGWSGPYLMDCSPIDPWGNEYAYARNGGPDWEVVTYGADGEPGGIDAAEDLSSRTILQVGR